MSYILRILVAGGLMGILDALWLGLVAKQFYKTNLGPLLLDKPNMLAGAAFYAIFAVGIVVLVVSPALAKSSWLQALWQGALLGLVAYAAYDLTNLATLKGFPVNIVVADLLWGTIAAATVSVLTYTIVKRRLS